MSKRSIKITLGEASHLLGLLYERKESGDYYGNREQYYLRTDGLIALIENAANEQGEKP